MILVLHLSIPYVSFDRHSVFETKEYCALEQPRCTDPDHHRLDLRGVDPAVRDRRLIVRAVAGLQDERLAFQRQRHLQSHTGTPLLHVSSPRTASAPAASSPGSPPAGALRTRSSAARTGSPNRQTRRSAAARLGKPSVPRSAYPRSTAPSHRARARYRPTMSATATRRVRLETETASKSRGGSGVVERALESLAQRANLAAQRGSICSPRVFSGEP